MNSKYKSLISNTFIFTIGSLGSKLITFILVPLYTNILTQAEYGTADLVTSIASILVPIVGVVIQDSILRFGLSKEYSKGSVIRSAVIVLVPGVFLALVVTPLFSFYPAVKEWKWYIFSLSSSTMIYNVVFTYAKAKERNKLYAAGSIFSTFILAITSIVTLIVFDIGVKGYLLANVLCVLIPSIVMFFLVGIVDDIKNSSTDLKLLKEMLKFSFPLIANNLSWWILSSSDKVMIEWFLSATELGMYTAASKIPALISIITTIFSSAWTISSIKEYDQDKDKNFYANIFKYYSLLMFVGAVFVLLMLKPFMSIYVGKEFYDAWKFVPFLLVGTIYYSFGAFFGAIFGALKKNIACTITTIIAGIINITINIWLIPSIGVAAAAISTAISYIVIGLLRMMYSRKYFSFHIDFPRFAINSLVVLATSMLVYFEIINCYVLATLAICLLMVVNIKDITGLFTYMKSFILHKK